MGTWLDFYFPGTPNNPYGSESQIEQTGKNMYYRSVMDHLSDYSLLWKFGQHSNQRQWWITIQSIIGAFLCF